MPANLTPEYRSADARYRAATAPDEKLEALQDMLRVIPKHKGTDHMQADIKKKIAQTKREMGKKSATSRTGDSFHVPKEGDGQVVLVGPPNSGKSHLLAKLTNAEPEVADYPYTTRRPQPCMIFWEGVQIQGVDTPPISADFFENWMPSLVRNADLVVILLDLSSDDLLDDYEVVLEKLEERKLRFEKNPASRFSPDGMAWKKTMVVGNKCDHENAEANLEMLREIVDDRFEILVLSAETGEGTDAWCRRLFELLEVIRVYPKQPGKPADTDAPIILPIGATVGDFARSIHKDFEHKLTYAKIWGEGKHDGQTVNRDFVLADHDILEMHV